MTNNTKEMTMSSRNSYLELFSSLTAAAEFEAQCLAIGDEFLPQIAQMVRDGKCQAGPAMAYWDWLIAQHDQMTADDEAEENTHGRGL
jgi:hypothetical protein